MYAEAAADYARIEEAIRFLEQNFLSQPDLKTIAGHVGLSEYHFQRLFTRWAGISPKRFTQFLTIQYAKQLLDESRTLLETTYESGLSSPGRLHDLFVTYEAITPGDYKRKGAGLTIHYGFHLSPFGDCLLATTERGICGLRFTPANGHKAALTQFQKEWPRAQFVEDNGRVQALMPRIFGLPGKSADSPLRLLAQGTPFQLRVWQALLQIPEGMAASYASVAKLIGDKKAARAVGTAVGRNPIAYLIPCHRVIRQAGHTGEYRWGAARKKAMLAWEASRR